MLGAYYGIIEPGVESDVYQMLGSCGAEQSCSQLSMSFVKANMWKYMYHRDGKPDNKLAILFDKLVYEVNKPKKFHVIPRFFKQLILQ